MESFFSNQPLVIFITNLGLALFLVLYFVLVRDPKYFKVWKEQYEKLIDNYEKLKEKYEEISSSIYYRPLNKDEALALCDIGLERDLYKLYTLLCWKIDGERKESIGNSILHTVSNTNGVWARFTTPFSDAKYIKDSLVFYKDNGSNLGLEIEDIMNKEITNKQKKVVIWDSLLLQKMNMLNTFANKFS